jgi:hypothetical protein
VGEFDRGAWTLDGFSGRELVASRVAGGASVRKTITLGGGRRTGSLTASLWVGAGQDLDGVLELEWNLNLSGGGANPAAYYRWGGVESRHDSAGSVEAGVALSFGNGHDAVEITVSAEPPAAQAWHPVETVSQSEGGFERVYQGSCLVQRWPLRLAAGESASFSTMFGITQSRDRSIEELPD